MKRFSKWGLLLCLLALLPLNVHADIYPYGIHNGTAYTDVGYLYGTWNAEYHDEGVSASFSGSGTENDPYRINDVWDLCRLEDKVNAGNSFEGKYFKLMNNIDLTGKNWYPIGVKETAPFEGLFDGNDKTISNMSIVVKDADNSVNYSYGLFGHMKGVVRHLNMENGYIVINRSDGNQASMLCAGLLCGTMNYDLSKEIFGAVYECHIQGSIGGAVDNHSAQAFVGGIVGFANDPVSIYKCQADVEMTTTDIGYVGGIVGYSMYLFPATNTRDNLPNTPCISYIFDCVSNVDIKAKLRRANNVYCGGLCGFSYSNLLACVAKGTIECDRDNMCDYTMDQVEMSIGGLVGFNAYNILNCVSTVHLKGGKMVGGLVGANNSTDGSGLLKGSVVNSVFCGHIDSPDADHTHGLIGYQAANANAPVNCLFVGTMHGGKHKAPLSNGTTQYCYCDQNMYDDGKERSCYKYTDELCAADNSWFDDEIPLNIAYLSIELNHSYNPNTDVENWVIKEGFYPYFKVAARNLANDDIFFKDYVIAKAANYFNDDADVIRTPSQYNKYAWLASVPMNVPNHDFRTNFVDIPISLAIKQQQLEGNNLKNARFSISDEKMTVTGSQDAQTATPKDNVSGDVMLTITSDDNVSRQICLDVNTLHQWDGVIAKGFDSGDGTENDPYLIHNARQLMKAFTTNESGEYYKLTKDVWFNENLLTNTGEPKDGAVVWDHKTKRDSLNWEAHLDGNSHLIHGLYSTNAFGLLEKIPNGASIENTGFVDCLVWSPEADPENTETGYRRPFGFLTPSIGATAAVRNCLFIGVVKERRTNALHTDFGAFIHTIDNSEQQIGENPIIEDCVLSIVAKSDIADRRPIYAFLAHKSGAYTTNIATRRVLVLNNSNAESYLTPPGIEYEACHFPIGYLPYYEFGKESENGMQVSAMTNGTFFTGEGYSKWTARQGRFPLLTSFAATDYGKLIALPVYPSADNRLADMNYLQDFVPGAATWLTTNNSAFEIDTDIRVIEPKAASSSAYLVRSMNGAKMITPITTAGEITQGIQFADVQAKNFCLAHYDTNDDKAISLSELKNVTLEQFQADMNEDDGDPSDNDGELITRFPEFRYFAGIDDLGTSFHDKDKLEEVRLSGNITELSSNDFQGNVHMSSFTIPTSVTSVSGQAFSNSGLENYEVETDHAVFASVDGILFNKDQDQLLSFPSGRKNTSITIPDNVKSIASNAVYKMSALDSVHIDAADYDYETVVELGANAFTAADGKTITYFVEDATQDYEDSDDDDNEPANARLHRARRTKEVTTNGNGKGHLVSKYQESDFWKDKTVERYFTLEVSKKSKDNNGNYWATMYIGFDTQLPEGLTAFIVDKQKTKESESTLVLREISNKVRMLTPVVIRATKAGTYDLYPSKETKRYPIYPMSENLLEGVNRNGLKVNQADANDGGCLTLGKNASGQVGFFIYKANATIPAFRAYLTVNKVSSAKALFFSYADDESETTGINSMSDVRSHKSDVWYDVQGRKLGSKPTTKGIYINDGRKYVIK